MQTGEKALEVAPAVTAGYLVWRWRIPMVDRWPALALGCLIALSPTLSAQAPVGSLEWREAVRQEFERIDELPPAEQVREIPRVYREMSPILLLAHFHGEQPKMLIRAGEPPRFGTLSSRSQDLLAAHLTVVRPLIREDLRSNHRERVTHAVGVIGWLRLREFYDDVVAAFRRGAVEYHAAATLRDLDDPRAIRVLTDQNPEDPLRYYGSLRSLCKRRPADPALVKHLRSADAKTRWRAASALTESGDPILAPEVARLANDPDPKVREQAACMSQFIVTDKLGPDRKAVLALLDDKDVNVRIAAARRFAGQRDRACARTLLALLVLQRR
jgi:HEAT repeat protein